MPRIRWRYVLDNARSAVVGNLTGDEKIASLLIEAAQMLGTVISNTVDIPLPLSRGEIANYLALDPDTLSRLLRRLDVTRLVTFVGRRRVIVDDWQGLLRRSPIAEMLLRAYTR